MDIFTRWANRIVDATLGQRINPSNVWIGLSSTVPSLDGTGWTEISQAGYGGYARANLAGLIPSASNGLAANNTVISFPTPTTGGAIIAAVGIFDDPVAQPSSAGRAFKAVQPGVLVVAGRAIIVRASSLNVSVS